MPNNNAVSLLNDRVMVESRRSRSSTLARRSAIWMADGSCFGALTLGNVSPLLGCPTRATLGVVDDLGAALLDERAGATGEVRTEHRTQQGGHLLRVLRLGQHRGQLLEGPDLAGPGAEAAQRARRGVAPVDWLDQLERGCPAHKSSRRARKYQAVPTSAVTTARSAMRARAISISAPAG